MSNETNANDSAVVVVKGDISKADSSPSYDGTILARLWTFQHPPRVIFCAIELLVIAFEVRLCFASSLVF